MPTRVGNVATVPDAGLRQKEGDATAAFRRFFPKAPPLKLHRMSDGRIGFQAQILVAAGDRGRFSNAYAAVMRVLGEKRGRPPGVRKVQAKLRLEASVYKALMAAAKKSDTTLSGLVEDLARKAHLV